MLTKELCGFGIITHSCLRVLVLEKTSPDCYQEVEFTENITFLQYLAPGYCSINKFVWFETKCTILYNIPACRFGISWCDSISTVGSLSSWSRTHIWDSRMLPISTLNANGVLDQLLSWWLTSWKMATNGNIVFSWEQSGVVRTKPSHSLWPYLCIVVRTDNPAAIK